MTVPEVAVLRKYLSVRGSVYFLFVPITVLYTLAVVGCLSDAPLIPDLYLVRADGLAFGSFRIGYFGICVKKGGTACSPTLMASAPAISQDIRQKVNSTLTTDLIAIATSLQMKAFFPFPVAAGIIFLGAFGTIVGLKDRPKTHNSKHWAIKALWLSVAVGVVGALGAMCSMLALHSGSGLYGNSTAYEVEYGLPVLGMLWCAVVLQLVFVLSIGVGLDVAKQG